MAGVTILLPSAGELDRTSLIVAMGDLGIRLCDIDLPLAQAAPFATRVCAAIQQARPAAPLLIVAPPASAAHLPAIALAQRTARRRVTAYVLLEPGLLEVAASPSGADWPDAPVTCISLQTTMPDWVRLRDWQSVFCQSMEGAAKVIEACQDSLPAGANPINDLR